MQARYFLSKLIVLQSVREMSKLSPGQMDRIRPGVIINSPNPGWCKTALFRTDDGGFWGRNMLKLMGRKSEEGARTLTSAIAAGKQTHGQYLSECQVKPASAFVRSIEGHLDRLEIISPGSTKVLGAA
ncbi:hypothetical protein Slin15195_G028030 [Septoria linicola]|uniref:Uncharacterized protein n=1 Tax=Septoria linicola TaxID=215465 RepID=A0A9Q9EH07_9PEZI|nr:hypothetical protein Slin14017_G027080 [Septoria linicola]USW49484.1 hypothetical protein Slin15195_G028030 [Septoria linicola]